MMRKKMYFYIYIYTHVTPSDQSAHTHTPESGGPIHKRFSDSRAALRGGMALVGFLTSYYART